MVSIGTVVFRRIVEEARQAGADGLKKVAVKAISATMEETVRFGAFTKEYIDDCAARRLEVYISAEK